MINKTQTKVIYLLLTMLFFLISCNSQENIDHCKKSFNSGRDSLYSYLVNKNSPVLNIALNNIEKSIKCEETRRASIEIKIRLLMLLKEYKRGYEFVDSLNENDFKLKYKKNMFHDYFFALSLDSKGDTSQSNKIYEQLIFKIQDFINNEDSNVGVSRMDVFADLFLIKHMLLDPEEIDLEIDSLKNKYPDLSEYFDGLKGTINDLPKRLSTN